MLHGPLGTVGPVQAGLGESRMRPAWGPGLTLDEDGGTQLARHTYTLLTLRRKHCVMAIAISRITRVEIPSWHSHHHTTTAKRFNHPPFRGYCPL